jgi:amino acid adenylation domain-containing protein
MKDHSKQGTLARAISAKIKKYSGEKNYKEIRRPLIARADRSQPLPLSRAQQRLWFLDHLGRAARAAYNLATGERLQGKLNVDALRRALDRIVARHEMLRTTFVAIDGQPRQVIGATDSGFFLREHELSHMPIGEQNEAVGLIIQEESTEAFDLAKGPLIRGRLLKLSSEEHILLVSMHHIVADAWSGDVWSRELAALYGAFSRDLADPLPALEVQYADYAVWQRALLQGQPLQEQLEFWKAHLTGAPVLLELPTDRPRPEVQSYRGDVVDLSVSVNLTPELRRLSRSHKVTLFTTLLTGWSILLSRLSGQEDIVIGVPVANRLRPELEPLIGFFINTLAVRVRLEDNPSVGELLVRVQSNTLDAYSNQDIPFEQVVEALKPPRTLAHSPIFQVMLAMDNVPQTLNVSLPGLIDTNLLGESAVPQFDLSLSLSDKGDHIEGHLTFASDLFDRATVERMANQFQAILSAMAEDDSHSVKYLPFLSDAERQKVLYDFNNTMVDITCDRFIHELFEAKHDENPAAIAVIAESLQITYGELNTRANQLARHLIAHGVRPEHRVAICVCHGPELVVGLLAILKAGATYVPLDPSYPTERICYMIKESTPTLVLTIGALLQQLPIEVPKFLFDAVFAESLLKFPSSNINRLEQSVAYRTEDLAFLFFTSGTTGQPKGVGLEVRNVVHYLQWATQYYRIVPESVCPVTTSMSFDGIIMSILLPLLSGASVCFPIDPLDALVQGAISRRPFGFINTTNSQLNILVSKIPREALPYLSNVIAVGGELLSEMTLTEFRRCGRKPRLINDYGPTEASVSSTVFDVFTEAPREATYVHVGRPIWNTRIYVLDENLQPVPISVRGEVYIAGAGIARGYLNSAELTAQRFFEDPFVSRERARMYRTGDVGRWLPEGNLEILGRTDFQIKIRGFRVELGEIETHLLKDQAVRQAAVFPREDASGDRRLVAYIVANSESTNLPSKTSRLADASIVEWKSLFDHDYDDDGPAEGGPNFYGWNSSYTDEPLPANEMREWLSSTIASIKDLRPTNILEVGCGNGLLLQHLVPICNTYIGTDLSHRAIADLGAWATNPNVSLHQCEADHIDTVRRTKLDTVIINSVVQYFPDVDYLVSVIDKVVEMLSPTGTIFIGDVPNFDLITTFHTSVELAKSVSTATPNVLRARIARTIAEDNELFVRPALFHAMRLRNPKITAVEVNLKRGTSFNEMTKYRYDVVIQIGGQNQKRGEWALWNMQGSIPGLALYLQNAKPSAVLIEGIPNARLREDLELVERLARSCDSDSIAQIKKGVDPFDAIDPEVFWNLGDELGYHVRVTWSPSKPGSHYDVVLAQQKINLCFKDELSQTLYSEKPFNEYTNKPLAQRAKADLITRLRERLSSVLPEYMVPAAYVILDELPMTSNGKINWRLLPAPGQSSVITRRYEAPVGSVEEAIASIWEDLLELERVGRHDNFFELGGHSLMAVKMMSRLSRTLGGEFLLRDLFRQPTLQAFARSISVGKPSGEAR